MSRNPKFYLHLLTKRMHQTIFLFPETPNWVLKTPNGWPLNSQCCRLYRHSVCDEGEVCGSSTRITFVAPSRWVFCKEQKIKMPVQLCYCEASRPFISALKATSWLSFSRWAVVNDSGALPFSSSSCRSFLFRALRVFATSAPPDPRLWQNLHFILRTSTFWVQATLSTL